MSGRSLFARRPRRFRSHQSPQARTRVLRAELLEPRALLSGNSVGLLAKAILVPSAGIAIHAPVNAAPIIQQPISVNGNAAVAGKSASLSVLGWDDGGESNLVYIWSVASSPSGGTATFNVNDTNAANVTTATFTKAGTYTFTVKIVDAGGLSVSSSKSVLVSPTLTSVSISTAGGQVVGPNSTLAVPGVSQALVAQGLDQFGYALVSQPTFSWSTTTVPSGAPTPALTAKGASVTETFGRAGAYGLKVQAKAAGGATVMGNVAMNVTQVASGIRNVSTTPVSVWGTSQQLALPLFVDQFGNALAAPPSLVWSTTSLPLNASAPSFAIAGGVTTVTFAMAGSYVLNARAAAAPSLSFVTNATVNQTLTSIAVTPNPASVLQGATQQFTPQALDQFRQSMVNQQAFTWSASSGSVTAAGLFTAPSSAGSCTVTAKSGSVTGVANVTILVNSGGFQDPALAKLVQSLDADGSISRQDMIQILRSVAANGALDAADLSDLKKLLSQAATYNIPGYVQVLAGDVVNGNAANATFQGQPLGNLTVGSSATQLNDLIGKWFLGTDLPTLSDTSLVYKSVAGSLFPQTPSHNDEYQGELGDCYFISALGTLADSNPAAIQNMFINNGDGTYTVRFYTGTYGTIYNYSNGSISAGFTNNVGTADYVTVNSMLPVGPNGTLAYADYDANYANAANSLWIPLAEKAYAQWNQTGKEGRDGTNAYASIQGGWMATVDAQVLGHNATDYIMTNTSEQVAIQALAAKEAVTIGTLQWSGTVNGLYASHAYAIVGYNASTDKFILYNPWGFDQPGPLSWSQLQADCSQMAVADTSGSISISGVVVKLSAVQSSFFGQTSDMTAGASASPAAATAFTQPGPASAAAPRDQFFAATSAAAEVFEMLGNGWTTHRPPAPSTHLTHHRLSASLVDAMFALDSVLAQSDV